MGGAPGVVARVVDCVMVRVCLERLEAAGRAEVIADARVLGSQWAVRGHGHPAHRVGGGRLFDGS